MRSDFGDVPLTRIFPRLSPADATRMRQAADSVDAADWDWFPEHAVFPGPRSGTAVVLGRDVIVHADGSDRMEFSLHVVWTDGGRLAVDAAVNVACWCDTEHATHDVDAFRRVVGEGTSLPDAFCSGAERLKRRLADPRDADYWRARAGLPQRWVR
ncbi:hypothetical protein [Streptomyces termitum]|uniref:hypothetical protein n=1 Tax=Streptomyces termitum TaxID=67368 RepID=UPI0033BF1FA9